MPFGPDPAPEAFTLERHDLILTRAAAADAQEAFDLLWHPAMTFVEDDVKPPSVAAGAESFERLRLDSQVDGVRRFQWVARRKDSGVLVALAVGELDSNVSLQLQRKEDGNPGDIVQVENRIIEATVYVHPEHQEEKGSYWGTKAADLVYKFGRLQFECNVRRAKILLTNTKSQRRAETTGRMVKQSSGDPPGYGIWEGPFD